MAQKRYVGKRRLTPLTISLALLALATTILSGCNSSRETGWFAPDSITTITVGRNAGEIRVEVELPEGYEPAEEFVQRASLRSGDVVQTDAQTMLERPFTLRLDAPGAQAPPELSLELLIGFCEPEEKDVCYIDTSSIAVVRSEDSASTRATTITYRPERPQ